ncbi:MAG: ABC transporter ATP-binding protein [Ruminococcaceae bacterium]|nr:ABC transporter ATP-binding protein [Oscillospiraceae bacterium]
MENICVKLTGICKSFGSVKANQDINFDVREGEIHALLGENGSGKSTLMNILSGIYSPDAGTIELDGAPVMFTSPMDSIKAGIGMVHQHFKLVDVLTAKENIIAGTKDSGFFTSGRVMTEKICAVEEKYGLKLDPDKKVYNMSVSEKQTCEILKVLCRGAKILILDEPTAVLTPQEIRVLFDILRGMKKAGCSIVIITHKMAEVLEISDRVTILRRGRSIKTLNTAETGARELTELMVGHPISLDIDRAKTDESLIKPILDVKTLTVMNGEGRRALDEVSFSLSSGEILGVAGIAGSGQKELCETIAGLDKVAGGEIIFKGSSIVGLSPRDIIRRGVTMSFVPEDRLGMGLVGSMSIIDNVLLKSYQNMPGVMMDRATGRKVADEIIERFEISTPSAYHTVKKLSGGNIQKVLLGREINLNPELLITAYPVRGLDIGASYNIYDVLNEQKQKGVGILFIGEDLDVLLGLADRIMVLHEGKVMGILDAASTTKEELGLLMLGHTETEADEVKKNA